MNLIVSGKLMILLLIYIMTAEGTLSALEARSPAQKGWYFFVADLVDYFRAMGSARKDTMVQALNATGPGNLDQVSLFVFAYDAFDAKAVRVQGFPKASTAFWHAVLVMRDSERVVIGLADTVMNRTQFTVQCVDCHTRDKTAVVNTTDTTYVHRLMMLTRH